MNSKPSESARPSGDTGPQVSAATPDAQWVLLERAEAEHYRKMFLEASRQQDRMFWLLCFAVVMALAWMAVALWALTG